MDNKYQYLFYFSLFLLLPLPTEFYYFSRIVMCAGFIFAMQELSANLQLERDKLSEGQRFIYNGPIFLIMACIYNPIFPIFLYERFIWALLNAASAWMFWKINQDYKN